MKPELHYLLWTAVLTGALWIPVVVGYVTARGPIKPQDYKIAPTSPLPPWVNRANRAHMNAIESFAPFAAVVFVGNAAGISTSITTASAGVFFWARVAHAVAHVSGVGVLMLRTVLFVVAWMAFMAFAVELLRHAI